MHPLTVSLLAAVGPRWAHTLFRAGRRAARAGLVALVLFVVLACSGKSQTTAPAGVAGSAGSAGLAGSGSAGSDPTIGEAGTGATTAQGGVGAGGVGAPSGGSLGAALTALAVVPAESTLVVGGQLPLVVMGTNASGQEQDVTSLALFVSSDPTVATVRSRVVTARSNGQATVTASVGALSANATITVDTQRATALTVKTSKPTMASDDGTQLSALATMVDGSTRDVTAMVVWVSSDAKVARLIQTGFLVAMGQGTATVTATLGDLTGSVKETVTGDTLTSYTIAGAHVMRLVDRSVLHLHAHFGATRDVLEGDARFESSDPSVFTISDRGELDPVAPGTATVSAQLTTSTVATAEVVVTGAELVSIQLVGPSTYEFCNPPALKAIGTFSDGTSYDVSGLVDGGAFGDSASVSSLGGDDMRIAPAALGSAEIELSVGEVQGVATFTALLGSPTSITVDVLPQLPVSAASEVTASAHCPDQGPTADVTSLVHWTSDDPTVISVAPVLDSFEAKAIAVGTTNIRATYPGFTIAPAAVSVFDAAPLSLELYPDNAGQFEAPSLFPMQANGVYADYARYQLTSTCTWSSSAPLVATVSNTPGSIGNLTVIAAGSFTVTAKCGALTVSVDYQSF